MATAKAREYSFDVVKFLAISIIVLHHYQQDVGAFFEHGPNWYGGEFYWGYLVELFFIISGYFAFSSVVKIRLGESFGSFYLKKYLRFLPMIVICGAICLVTKYLCLTYVDHQVDVTFTLWNIVASLTGVARWLDTALMVNNPMWYVSVLLLCLIVFYFATAKCRRESDLALVYGAVIGVGLVMRSVCAGGIQAPFFNADIARGLISFFLGLELAFLFKRHPRAVNAVTIATAIAVIALFIFFYAINRDGLLGDSGVRYYTLVFLVYPAVIFLCKAPALLKIPSSGDLSFLGGCAFNMYVWHLPLLFLYRIAFDALSLNPERQMSMYAFLALCIGVGLLSNRFLDEPIAARVARRFPMAQKATA